MDKIKSGVEGFDNLVYGGLPKGRTYLVSGEPGTGKTLFTLQFLIEGLKKGEKCVYISIDEKPEHVILDSKNIGWDLSPYLENGLLQIFDVTAYFSISHLGDFDGDQVSKAIEDIMKFVRDCDATRLAIDPIAPLVFAQKPLNTVVQYIRTLVFTIEAYNKCTTLLTSYVPVGSEKVSLHGVEEFASSGIILLKLVKVNNKFIRTIRIKKMRGTQIDLSEYHYDILPERGLVLRAAL